MPISRFLNDQVDAETRRVMGVAFELTLAALRLSDKIDKPDLFVGMVAKKIIALAKDGETNPDLLCERVLAALQGPQPYPVMEARRTAEVKLLSAG